MIVINSQKYIVANEATKSTGQFVKTLTAPRGRRHILAKEKMHEDSLRFSGLSALQKQIQILRKGLYSSGWHFGD